MLSLHSLRFDLAGWELAESSPGCLEWNNPQGDAMALNFFPEPPDLPGIDLNLIRAVYRSRIAAAGGGLVNLDVAPVAGIPSMKAVFKMPQQPSGMTYQALLTIPFREASYVFRLQSQERGVTGMRDTAIFLRMAMNGSISFSEDGSPVGWTRDPYDPSIATGVLANLSEQEQYDQRFPDHPLSRVRRYLAQVESTAEFEAGVGRRAAFFPIV